MSEDFREAAFRALSGYTDIRVVAMPTLEKIRIEITPSFTGREVCIELRGGDALTLADLLSQASKSIANFQRRR